MDLMGFDVWLLKRREMHRFGKDLVYRIISRLSKLNIVSMF